MKAIALRDSAYQIIDTAIPEPAKGQVRVRVAYAGVNRADYLQAQGLYPLPDAGGEIPGLELSGIVDAVGDGCGFAVGQPVSAIVRQGAFAEYAVVDAAHVVPLPEACGLDVAAAVTEALATMQMALYERCHVASGRWVLLHGAAGGIGHIMLQWLASEGVQVIAAVSSDEKSVFCRGLGAAATVDYSASDWADQVKKYCPDGVDAALDMAGGDVSGQMMRLLKKNGCITTIACLSGSTGQVSVGRMLTHRLQWSGCTLRDAPGVEKDHIMRVVGEELLPNYCTKGLSSVIRRFFPFMETAEAVQQMVHERSPGKTLIKIAA